MTRDQSPARHRADGWRVLRAAALAAFLAACAREPAVDRDSAAADSAGGAPSPAEPARPPATEAPVGTAIGGDRALTLAGLGAIAIGRPPPAALVEDEAQIAEDCRTLASPRYPDVYAMSDGRIVTRITVMRDSPVTTERGIGVGASEAEVRRAYPGLSETPHEYGSAPAKNLGWRPEDESAGLRFEIGGDGRVSMIHAGVPPFLDYSEGCA